MSANSSSSSGGIGFAGLLTIVFITLKLTGYIDWSWVWVLAPMWIGFAVALFFVAIALIIVYFATKQEEALLTSIRNLEKD